MAETIGSLIDKITIVDLKIYHMQEQIDRRDASPQHQEACQNKLKILKIQKDDLSEELSGLAKEVLQGNRELKVYRQFKMYNDPIYQIKRDI
ncbi:hypothetical protein BVX98_06500 [bacterium F11]|nr:hypothetical protein BVX98_06500 [bacterium F11]